VKITLARGADAATSEPLATGGVAVTLGETAAGLEGAEVVIVAVTEGSEAERAGLAPGDVVIEVGGARVKSIADARARLSGPVHDDVVVKVHRTDRILALRVPREAVRR
jgi:C-terminal processing protease CtpA/Prc